MPQQFFAVMREGLEASIRDRYPKLIERQMIPCPCQDSSRGRCTHSYDITMLEEMLLGDVQKVRCEKKPFREVGIAKLLSGFENPVEDTGRRLEEMEANLSGKLDRLGEQNEEMGELVRDGFQYLLDDRQKREETHCPPLFVLWKAAKGKAFHVPMRLALVCQHRGQEHIACRVEDAYNVDALKGPLRRAAPLLKQAGRVLKYAKLTGLPFLKEWDKAVGDAVGDFQELANEMLEDFDEIAGSGEAPTLLEEEVYRGNGRLQEKQAAGAALREFRALLEKLDPTRRWHGLVKKKSSESGDFLWVCEEHAREAVYK